MKSKLFLSIIILSLFYCCEKDEEIDPPAKLDSFLIVGDETASITTYDTLITPAKRCSSILYKIDLDADELNDVAFYIYYCYSPSHFTSYFNFDCLTDKVKVLTNDSIQSPEILEYGDTLNLDRKWTNGSMGILRASGRSCLVGGNGVVYKTGNWYDLSNKYVGLLIENDDHPVYGWIKLSVPDDDWIASLTVHESGYKKAAY